MRFGCPEKDVEGLVIGVCTGASGFYFLTMACCTLTVILPLVVYLPQAKNAADGGMFWYILFGAFLTFGMCYFFASLSPVLKEPPTPPALHGPFANATAANPSYQKIDVKNIFVFVNPHGGQGTAIKCMETAEKIWKDAGANVTVFKTERAGHIWDHMRELDISQYDAVCAIGGDGTFHELVNGYRNRKDKSKTVTLGLLPAGSGNSIMCDLGTSLM